MRCHQAENKILCGRISSAQGLKNRVEADAVERKNGINGELHAPNKH